MSMIRFSEEEIKVFRNDSRCGEFVGILQKNVESFLTHPLLIPESGVSDWSHYYYCPDCSVKLIHDPEKPYEHECPSCGKVFSDDRKNGAWWMLTNTSNANAAEDLGILYMLTGDASYAKRASEVLTGYAAYYPGYEVHGNIPYNGPGKQMAQTLDEAVFLRTLAYAYDLVADYMSDEERRLVLDGLFRHGASFLAGHRHEQLHNHEVIINGAIGVLALILGDEGLSDSAINGSYGLVHQLEKGTLADGFWFECSTAYHFYALENFFYYEKFARHTRYSNLSNPKYHDMVLAVLRLEKDDFSFPLLNDSHPGQGDPGAYGLFEFAYGIWHDEQVLRILTFLKKRCVSLCKDGFFYGSRSLPECSCTLSLPSLEGYGGLGASIARRKGDYLLFRHGPYGGEHDHYDRLAISYWHRDVPVSVDLGTTGYGAPLHYAYYKRTETHNTFCIDCENQAPSSGRLLEFREDDDRILMKAEVSWEDGYTMPDSFTIPQWNEKAYRNVVAERTLLLVDDGFLDILEVECPRADAVIDANVHFHGSMPLHEPCRAVESLGGGAYREFSDIGVMEVSGGIGHNIYISGDVVTDFFFSMDGAECFLATGPDNPSNKRLNYVVRRSRGHHARFVSFVSSGRSVRVSSVVFIDGGIRLHLENGIEKSYML